MVKIKSASSVLKNQKDKEILQQAQQHNNNNFYSTNNLHEIKEINETKDNNPCDDSLQQIQPQTWDDEKESKYKSYK